MTAQFYVDWEETSSRDPSLLFASEEQNFEIEWKNLEILEVLNKELFYTLQKGKLKVGDKKMILVTVKGASDPKDAKQQRMISDELQVLTDVKSHPNIVSFIGYVTNEKNQVSIVSELVEGSNLLDLVRKCQENGNFRNQTEVEEHGFVLINENNEASKNESADTISTADLISFALKIATGMKYLTDLSYVHRQLALHSVFLAKDKTIRIGDLGLARKDDVRHYYRIMNKEMPLPFHWMAPETFKDHKFTEKSDVWSYGICLWELFTLGKMPYQDVGDVLAYLERGRRLAKPEHCTQEIYDFMLKCWRIIPEERPTFAECVIFFEKQLAETATNEMDSIKFESNNA